MREESRMLFLLSSILLFAGVLAVISIFMRYGKTGLLPQEVQKEIRRVVIEPTDG